MTLLVGSIFHMTRKIVSEMTYNVSMGTLNPTIPYHVNGTYIVYTSYLLWYLIFSIFTTVTSVNAIILLSVYNFMVNIFQVSSSNLLVCLVTYFFQSLLLISVA